MSYSGLNESIMKATVHHLRTFVNEFLDEQFTEVKADLNYLVIDCYDYPSNYIVRCLNYYLREIVRSTTVARVTVIDRFRVKITLEHH